MPKTPVAIVGGGQAGLATSYWLQQRDIDHVVFEKGESGDTWRKRWDSFCLVSPNWSLRLPGMPYDGPDPHGFMPRDEIVEHVQNYRDFVDPPMVSPVAVERVHRDASEWTVETSEGDWIAGKVVVAGGSFQTPSPPAVAAKLSPEVFQIHSADYRNPDQLPPGSVLVVGSGQSGCQIADDLRRAEREVWLSVGGATRAPRRYRGRDLFEWVRDIGLLDAPMSEHPEGPEARYRPNPQVSGRDGGKDIDLREFGREGVQLVGRFADAGGAEVRFLPDVVERLEVADEACDQLIQGLEQYIAQTGLELPPDDREQIDWAPSEIREVVDLHHEAIAAVVWATGYSRDYSWIDGLEVDAHGYPVEQRGVTDLPGLYFVGLHGMHSLGSGLFWGVGADAEHVVDHLSG